MEKDYVSNIAWGKRVITAREIEKAKELKRKENAILRKQQRQKLINDISNKLKRTGKYVGKNLKRAGKISHKNIKTYAKAVKKNQASHGWTNNRISPKGYSKDSKKPKVRKVIYKKGRKIVYYGSPKRRIVKSKPTKSIQRNPYSMFGY